MKSKTMSKKEWNVSVEKRDGRIVSFKRKKITEAIFKAAKSVGGHNKKISCILGEEVEKFLKKKYKREKILAISIIQDAIEKVLIEDGHALTVKSFILYRDRRIRMRKQLKVRKEVKGNADVTDMTLLVSTPVKGQVFPWSRQKIVDALIKEAALNEKLAKKIALEVERKIFASEIKQVTTGFIRELVDNELLILGYDKKLKKQMRLGMPLYDIEQLVFSKSLENSNVAAHNPEAINMSIAETILKQYALDNIFSEDVALAHLTGKVHLHDLGYPTRVYCSSHSLEYIKKYGLNLVNLEIVSSPAKHARTLTGHLNTFLASMQAYYAGALGVAYLNIFYAPYLVGMSFEEMKQEAQYLIFSGSQNAFSRGGQTLFLDFNIHMGIPSYLKDVPAIGPKGEYTGKTYADYEKESQDFARALMDVWREGDAYGHIFAFPKMDLHVSAESFTDPKQRELLEYACVIASENGVPYFVFDRDEVTLSACCRLRTQIKDDYMIKHPESMRFCGFQNVTINLPQAAYRAGRENKEKLFSEIEIAMDIAMKAHLQKKGFIKKLMANKNSPLWQIGKIAADGRPYVDLEKATYIIGIIGLNECLQYLTGKQLHEDEEIYKLGLQIISFMFLKTKKYEKKYNLRVALEESPAESAARRLAKVDMREFPQSKDVIKGSIQGEEAYYTNSIHFGAASSTGLVDRIIGQSKFHTLIESGAITHAFIGEQKPPSVSIMNLVEKAWTNSKTAQLTISPEFTICEQCHRMTRGLVDSCKFCDSENVYGVSRVVGYFSRIKNWNKSKKGELKDRQKGNYSVA